MPPSPFSLGAVGELETDICVIGGGPAGIAFAREWIGRGTRVDLLESGSVGDDRRLQDLSGGAVASDIHTASALQHGRQRQLGGTPNLWFYRTRPEDGRRYARSVPPESIDLAARPSRSSSGWGLTLDQLAPFYERAQRVWNGARYDYEVETWSAPGAVRLDTADGPLDTAIAQHGPGDVFRERYRDEIEGAENVTIHVGCTVVELLADASGETIDRVRVVRSDGSAAIVRARIVVLAAGGIENAQLLLLSEPTRPGAVGNRHDNVGRYLTDHPEFRVGAFVPSERSIFDRLGLYDIRSIDGTLVSAAFTLKEAVKRQEDLLNVSLSVVPQARGFGSDAHRSLSLLRQWLPGGQPLATSAGLGGILRSPRDTLALLRSSRGAYHDYLGGWSRPEVDRTIFETIEVHAATEQSAVRDNRVTLGEDRDVLGRRRPRLEMVWSEADRQDVGRSIRLAIAELGRVGLGRFEPWVAETGPTRPFESGIHHPMGATRMAADAREGVVDMSGLVHGMANLYVAGSSVFASGHGYANPTLSLLALALRLSDHVATRLG